MMPNIGFAPDAVFGTGFASVNPVPTLPPVGTRAQVKTSLGGDFPVLQIISSHVIDLRIEGGRAK